MNCEDYQQLIDRGWRRSGSYCYKPVMNVTCCPLYTIRCNSIEFRMNHSHKKCCKKVSKFLAKGGPSQHEPAAELDKDDTDEGSAENETPIEAEILPTKAKPALQDSDMVIETASNGTDAWKVPTKKARLRRLERKLEKPDPHLKTKAPPAAKSLEDFLQLPADGDDVRHRLEIRLVGVDAPEMEATIDESHRLYVKYQVRVHQDKPDKCTMEQFTRFLVKSPLKRQPDVGPPMGYGSFHQQYWLDGRLLAVGVIDILPRCLSSVYFYYDPDYHFLSLGTYASLREIAFTRQLSQSNAELCWYYLGFYIHSCPKMVYKGQYKPSFLLCPESYTWHPIGDCVVRLDQTKYSRFADDSVEDYDAKVNLAQVGILHRRQIMSYNIYRSLKRQANDHETVKEYATLVGMKTATRMLLYRS